MTNNQSKLRLIEDDLLNYHLRRMDQRIGGYMRQLIEEQSKAEPDAEVLLRLRTQIKRDELSKFTPDVTEREVLEPLRAAVVHEAELERARGERRRLPPEMGAPAASMSALGLEVHEVLAAEAGLSVVHVGTHIDYFSPVSSLDAYTRILDYGVAPGLARADLISATLQAAEGHPPGKRRKPGDATGKRKPSSRSVPSE